MKMMRKEEKKKDEQDKKRNQGGGMRRYEKDQRGTNLTLHHPHQPDTVFLGLFPQ